MHDLKSVMKKFTSRIDTDFEMSDSFAAKAYEAMYNSRPGGVHEPTLRDPIWVEQGLNLLGTCDVVLPHYDSEEMPPYSYHLVLVNSGFIIKHPEEEFSLMEPQRAGSLVMFNSHKRHMLSVDLREGTWCDPQICDGFASLVMNLPEKVKMEAALEMILNRAEHIEMKTGQCLLYRKGTTPLATRERHI